MAKIKLGNPPKSVSKELKIPQLDGSIGTIKVDYKYRTRKEFAEFVDGMTAAIKAEGEAMIAAAQAAVKAAEEAAKAGAPVEPQKLDFGPTQTEQNDKKAQNQAAYIMGCVLGWDLDIAFDREAVDQLIDEIPQAADAIIQSYREAMQDGRRGN